MRMKICSKRLTATSGSTTEAKSGVDGILSDLRRLGAYYTGFSLEQKKREALREAFSRLRSLI